MPVERCEHLRALETHEKAATAFSARSLIPNVSSGRAAGLVQAPRAVRGRFGVTLSGEMDAILPAETAEALIG